jgi:hypothetical protein
MLLAFLEMGPKYIKACMISIEIQIAKKLHLRQAGMSRAQPG